MSAELLYSAVGYNQSPAGYDFAWEHAYERRKPTNATWSTRTIRISLTVSC